MTKTPKMPKTPDSPDGRDAATPDATDNAKTRAATDGRRYDPLTHQWLSAPPPAPAPPDDATAQE